MKKQEEIIAYLKANPKRSISQVANALKVPYMEVTESQKATLKCLKRDSPYWGLGNESVIKK